MAVINVARREIEVKVVYYGPAFSGKTTNVEILYRIVPATQRGELHSLRTAQDRTLFFDYVPVELGEIAGFKARYKLFTVPGQVYYKETRRVVLQGADAVVFVADSSPDRAQANLDALVDLEENLQAQNLDLASIPLVLQLNKRDVADALAADAMAADLNPFGVPVVEAIASEGRGVLETLRRVVDIAGQRVLENVSGQANALQVSATEAPEREDDGAVIREHLDRIRDVRARETAHVHRLQAAGWVSAEDVNAFLVDNVVRHAENTPVQPLYPAQAVAAVRAESYAAAAQAEAYAAGAASSPFVEAARHVQAPAAAPVAVAAPAPATLATPGWAPLPEGPPVEAWIAGPPARVREVRGAEVGPDGRVRLEVALEVGGQVRVSTVTLGSRPPEPPRWVTATSAGTIAGGLGMLVGIGIGLLVGWMGG